MRSFRCALVLSVLPNHPNVVLIPMRDDLAVRPNLLVFRHPDTGLLLDVPSMTGLDKSRLIERIGAADAKILVQVRQAVTDLLDL
jgi:hypothetical protein